MPSEHRVEADLGVAGEPGRVEPLLSVASTRPSPRRRCCQLHEPWRRDTRAGDGMRGRGCVCVSRMAARRQGLR